MMLHLASSRKRNQISHDSTSSASAAPAAESASKAEDEADSKLTISDGDNNNYIVMKSKGAAGRSKTPLQAVPTRFLEETAIRLGIGDEGRLSAPSTREPMSKEPRLSRKDKQRALSEKARGKSKGASKDHSTQVVGEVSNTAHPVKNSADNKSNDDNQREDCDSNLNADSRWKKQTHNNAGIRESRKEKEEPSNSIPLSSSPPKPTTISPPPEPNSFPIFKRTPKMKKSLREQSPKVVPTSGFNVVLTHCTADFDSLASAVGLAKLWALSHDPIALSPKRNQPDGSSGGAAATKNFDSTSDVPTFVVLPRGAHPGVHRFLALHKHLFPIRSLRSLPDDLTGLNRLGLVDAQRRDRIGPAENLLQYAKRVTVVDHHIDSDTDIPEATDYVVDEVGSVSTLMAERLQQADLELTEAEATLLALGIHADTGSLCYDSTTPRDAMALAWVMSQGASQPAIAEHAQASLSPEQQGVLTQALINANSTKVHGVTLSTVLLSADGFINGLAAVTQDAMELSSSDLFLLSVVYEAQSGSKRRSKEGNKKKHQGERLTSRLLHRIEENAHAPAFRRIVNQDLETNLTSSTNFVTLGVQPNTTQNFTADEMVQAQMMFAEAWRGGEVAMRRRRLQAAFDRTDLDCSGYLERHELAATLAASGMIASEESIKELMEVIDEDGDGKVNFEEFVNFALDAEQRHDDEESLNGGARACTMIIIGRVKAGVNMKAVKLNRLLERFGGGGHAKAASATIRLGDESEAEGILQDLVDEIINTSLQDQLTVGDFMTAPVLSVKPHMTEKQVEDLFTRYDVRALPVVDDDSQVIGLVTYKEVAAAKQRLWNKEQKRLRREKEAVEKGIEIPRDQEKAKDRQRKTGSTVKGWMKQHVRLVEDTTTMAELEAILLESDVGCIPVVAGSTKKLIGIVTRTDLLRQHRYYPSLHYHNKGFADSISARKPIIELRKRLKKFDLENE